MHQIHNTSPHPSRPNRGWMLLLPHGHRHTPGKDFAKDTTFRTGEINRYVLLPENRKDYRKDFEESGVTVVKDLNELRNIIMEESTNILTNL